MQIAFYKGPPRRDWLHSLSHYAIRLWTWSRYSHAELVINGVCYSASSRDGGVRSKVIDLASGRWDVVPIEADAPKALAWMDKHAGDRYDWAGVWRFVVPFLPHSRRRWFCFEALGSALGWAGTHKLTANDLMRWAKD